eukprot:3977247-Heterocapsa_arctica.AAC.1
MPVPIQKGHLHWRMISPVNTSRRLQQTSILIGNLQPHNIGQVHLRQRDVVDPTVVNAVRPSRACRAGDPCVGQG